MAKIGEAIAFGAATIVNAIAIGKGSAFGINLWTKARVELKENSRTIKVKILPDVGENPRLAKKVVKKVFKRFNVEGVGARVETESNIPIAKGLKSSSVAANAVVLATLAALGEKLNDLEVVKLGVEAAIESGVTITGAFDDACASYFGNVVITNNLKRKVERFFKPEEEYEVLIYVPEIKSYTSAV
ncbi:TPA: shikimate kinase, partial [Candidatus Bathyarchaeota archaeon]|nr:shikimate kinase [Candidatus Bathyarchaeota archaeon]